ncbi:MAG: hypothetical protein IPG06_23840, partial [Haliea sp.]|nr:hypothetical protein [Haliea sp.]
MTNRWAWAHRITSSPSGTIPRPGACPPARRHTGVGGQRGQAVIRTRGALTATTSSPRARHNKSTSAPKNFCPTIITRMVPPLGSGALHGQEVATVTRP